MEKPFLKDFPGCRMTGMTGTVGDSKMLTNGVMPPPMGMMLQTSIMVRFPKF